MSFGPYQFSSLKCYHFSSACYCHTKFAVRTKSIGLSTQELSVSRAMDTEVPYRLEGHPALGQVRMSLGQVRMSLGQPAAPPHFFALNSETRKAPVCALLVFCPPKLAVGDF